MDNAAELVSFWIREQKFFELPIKTVLVKKRRTRKGSRS